MKKILITGSNGFLGSNLADFFSGHPNYQVFSTSQHLPVSAEAKTFFQGSLLDTGFVRNVFSATEPDIVINTVSLVNVDQCEEKPALAYDITVKTAGNLAAAAEEHKCRVCYISTDHLFDGKKPFYSEQDTPSPINEYGKTKLLAEQETMAGATDPVIIRTNFFGWSPRNHPPTFGEWLYDNLKEQRPMTLFTNYYFSPIEVHYLAEAIDLILKSDFSGIMNIAGSERCSKYEFGMRLARLTGFDASVITPAEVSGISFKAPRQPDLSLSVTKFEHRYQVKTPGLDACLRRFLDSMP